VKQRLSELALIGVGGTITTVAADSLDLAGYHESGLKLGAGDLLDQFPEAGRVAAVEAIEFREASSTDLTDSDWIELVALVNSLREGKSGVVILHGTNTIEETAYFLDLCLDTETPVVLAGAMRPISALSSDAGMNLVRALQVAASLRTVGSGVVVMVGEKFYPARHVTKTSTWSGDAFRGGNWGPLGFVAPDGEVVIERTERRGLTFLPPGRDEMPRVDIVMSHVGADGALIDAAVTAGARGIVSAGAGAGRTTKSEWAALERAVEAGVAVCLSSRVESAWTTPTPGTLASGFVAGRGLPPWKARILLALALTRTAVATEIQALFDQS
jgi:L-asparaginase